MAAAYSGLRAWSSAVTQAQTSSLRASSGPGSGGEAGAAPNGVLQIAEDRDLYLARHPAVPPKLLSRMEPWYPLAFTPDGSTAPPARPYPRTNSPNSAVRTAGSRSARDNTA